MHECLVDGMRNTMIRDPKLFTALCQSGIKKTYADDSNLTI